MRKRPIEVPSLNNPNHVFDIYGESDSDVNCIEDFSKGEDKRNSKEYDYANMDLEKDVEKPQFPIVLNFSCALLKSKTTCLHVSFTTYEYFYKLSKGASFS